MTIPTISLVSGPATHTEHHRDILHVVATEIPLDQIADLRVWIDGIHVELTNGHILSCQWRDRTWNRSYAEPERGLYEIAVLDSEGCIPIPGHYDTVLGYACLSQVATLARYAISRPSVAFERAA